MFPLEVLVVFGGLFWVFFALPEWLHRRSLRRLQRRLYRAIVANERGRQTGGTVPPLAKGR